MPAGTRLVISRSNGRLRTAVSDMYPREYYDLVEKSQRRERVEYINAIIDEIKEKLRNSARNADRRPAQAFLQYLPENEETK